MRKFLGVAIEFHPKERPTCCEAQAKGQTRIGKVTERSLKVTDRS